MSNAPTGPITFSHPVAREQLESEGVVVTFRSSKRTTGDTWWRSERLGEKEGDVTVTWMGRVTPTPADVARFAPLSGFATPCDWVDAINEINGDVTAGHLYRVETRGPDA